MRMLVTGSSGLVGSALVKQMSHGGREVVRLVRREPQLDANEVGWDPAAGTIDAAAMEGCQAAVHLAGESVAGRWTAAKKARIRDSRVEGTRLLAEALAGLAHPPSVLACASAIGVYGDRADEELTEESEPGEGFLADVCRDWEAAAEPAAAAGIRVAHLRFGIVLSRRGGALARMLGPFCFGLGGVLGSGRQWWSWVALDDVLAAIEHVLATETLGGPVNVAAPHPVTNREFTRTLGRVLRRPTFFWVPGGLARLALGQMADEMLLASARVLPRRLLDTGFSFRHPDLEGALRAAVRS
ncbi:MAG: TIGR01777 family oxidoreductase [Planctomycetota bacterium]